VRYLLLVLVTFFIVTLPAFAKEWNIMIYMAADNNLDSFAARNLAQIAKVGSTDFMDVTVMYDGLKTGDSKYMHYGKDGKVDNTKSIGEIDCGDITELDKFVQWSKTNYPAKHNFLVLWNHGSGWNFRGVHVDGIAYDDNGTHITTLELGNFINYGTTKFDVLSYDACLMQMIELVYQVKDNVKYVLGSETLEPGEGWRYDKILLRGNFQIEDFLRNMVSVYGTYAETLSAINVAKFNQFLPTLKNWMSTLTREQLTTIKTNATVFSESDGVDLGNLLQASDTKAYAEYQKMFVASVGTGSFDRATGLAIYLPSYRYDSKYSELDFARDFPAWVGLIR
jgi:hypothetical protein